MANEFIQAEEIVEAAMLLLQREIVLPRTVWRQADASYTGRKPKDDTITLSIPGVVDARTRTMRANTALTADEIAETSVPVQLTTHVYSLLNIRDEDLTLSIRDFTAQVLAPQIRAVAEGLEAPIATALGAADWEATAVAFTEGTDEPYDVLVDAGKALNKLNVPRAGRFFVCGANVEGALLKSDKLSKVNESGTSDALREAMITRVAGFTVVGSNALGEDEAYAYHPTAVAFAQVAPALPEGATMKARLASDGLAMRYLRDYNPTATNGPVDRSLVDAFVGAKSVEEGDDLKNFRGVAIDFTPADGS